MPERYTLPKGRALPTLRRKRQEYAKVILSTLRNVGPMPSLRRASDGKALDHGVCRARVSGGEPLCHRHANRFHLGGQRKAFDLP